MWVSYLNYRQLLQYAICKKQANRMSLVNNTISSSLSIIFLQKKFFFAKFRINFTLRTYSSCDSHKQCYKPTVHIHVYSIILPFLTWDLKVTKAIASSTSHNMGSSSSCLHIPNASASSCCRTSKWSNTYSNSQEMCDQFGIAGHLWAGFTVMHNSFSSSPCTMKDIFLLCCSLKVTHTCREIVSFGSKDDVPCTVFL